MKRCEVDLASTSFGVNQRRRLNSALAFEEVVNGSAGGETGIRNPTYRDGDPSRLKNNTAGQISLACTSQGNKEFLNCRPCVTYRIYRESMTEWVGTDLTQ